VARALADSPAPPGRRPAAAWAPLAAVGGALTVLLIAGAGRYGYRRDERYFLRAGQEPAFGYVDQPPLTPVIAAAMDALAPDSLIALRVPSAIAMGLVVVLTGLITREFGGGRAAQLLAAAATAVSGVVLIVGHLLSTTTSDLLFWTAMGWLVARALRDDGPVWLAAGAVAGLALQNKTLPAFLLAALLAGLLIAGPRTALASRWLWAGAAVALLAWAPNLVWQAANGWPLLDLAEGIAGGSSGTSEPWYLFVPFQLVLLGPLLVPVWVAGLWRLARDPELRTWRAFAVAYVLLAVLFLVTGGKPYYLAGLYPVLLAAGADPVLRWLRRWSTRTRAVVVSAVLGFTFAVSAVLGLPLVPVDRLAGTPIPVVNYDAGETVGWPELVDTVTAVRAQLPSGEPVAVVTRNYGQAGAIDRFAPDLGPAYSGHMAYWDWGPPDDATTTAIVVGWPEDMLRGWFGEVRLAATVDNGVGLENDEQGTPVWIVADPARPWSQLWPELRRVA
jgi:Dolichyl-phosphate-mannose-protein mannosyltransferase